MRPIDYLLGNINPNTGLPINSLVKDQNFPRPVKINAMPSLLGANNMSYNQNIQTRDGSAIPVRQLTNVGSLPQDRRTPSLLTPNLGAINQDSTATGLLGTSFRDPRTVGALNASSELLKLGGASVGKPAPTLGQGLGFATQAYLKGMQGQEDRIAKQQMTGLQSQLDLANYINKVQEMQLGIQKSKKEDLKTAFTQEKNLRDSFIKESKLNIEAIKGFNKVARASTAEPSGANDVALIFGFMKTIDPNSVVREGEFATAENTGGVGERIRSLYNRLLQGERLTETQRKNFLKSAEQQVQQYVFSQGQLETTYSNLAGQYNLNPKNVVQSKLPIAGSYLQPIQVTSLDDAENRLKAGQFFILNGQIGVID